MQKTLTLTRCNLIYSNNLLYKKYEYLNIIRNEGAHINLKGIYFPLEKIDKEIQSCLEELDILIENKEQYNKSFFQYEKDLKIKKKGKI